MTDALVLRCERAGGSIRLGLPAERIVVRGGRAVGVVTSSGTLRARRAVLAACDAQILYGRLLDESDLPTAFMARMGQFTRAGSTVKVNYALSQPVPWADDRARGAGTVHVADSVNELSATAGEIAAPGFGASIMARDVQGPDDMERANPSLIGGDISGGTTQMHQQLVFRPVPGLARPEPPITNLYLASSSAHPGGSVHGACGANGARAALLGQRVEAARRGAPVAAAAIAAGAIAAAGSRRSQ